MSRASIGSAVQPPYGAVMTLFAALLCLPVTGDAQDKALSETDRSLLEAQLPSLRRCVSEAQAAEHKVDGVFEVHVTVRASGRLSKVTSRGRGAAPMMWCIDQALKTGLGLSKRRSRETRVFRLRVLTIRGKGYIRLHPDLGPFLSDRDNEALAPLLPSLTQCAAESRAHERRRTGLAQVQLTINTNGRVISAHVSGRRLDLGMTHCMEQRLLLGRGFERREEPQALELSLEITPSQVNRGPDRP